MDGECPGRLRGSVRAAIKHAGLFQCSGGQPCKLPSCRKRLRFAHSGKKRQAAPRSAFGQCECLPQHDGSGATTVSRAAGLPPKGEDSGRPGAEPPAAFFSPPAAAERQDRRKNISSLAASVSPRLARTKPLARHATLDTPTVRFSRDILASRWQ